MKNNKMPNKKATTKKITTKCINCKKRVARYTCICGLDFCGNCSDSGDYCPADEGIEHSVEKIKTFSR